MRTRCAHLIAVTGILSMAAAPPIKSGLQHPSARASSATPARFADGVISTVAGFETHPAFSLDERTVYFISSNDEFSRWTIMQSHLVDGNWATPVTAGFSGTHRDADPFITLDGSRLYFISDRPVSSEVNPEAHRGMDIWVMQRDEKAAVGWSEPRNPGPPINSPGNEWYPTVARDGTIYFGSDRRGGSGGTDLYCAKPRRAEGEDRDSDIAYEEPVNLGPIVNSAAHEFEPFIDPDQRFLIFMAAGRVNEIGGGDLYITFRAVDPVNPDKTEWSPPRLLGHGINTPHMEISASVSRDGKLLYFGSARPRGAQRSASTTGGTTTAPATQPARGDIYFIDATAVIDSHALKQPPARE